VARLTYLPLLLALIPASAFAGVQSRSLTVVLDPGHGGAFPHDGAHGRGGLVEKDVALAVARKLRTILERSGASVVLTRETDLDVLPGQTTQVSLELLSTTGGIDIVVTWGAICTPAPSGLVSWWTGDGNANDRIGGNDGSTVNGAGFASGKVGRAFNFNGVDQFVRIPGSPSLNPPGSLTIEAWIYPTNDTTANIFAEWGGDS